MTIEVILKEDEQCPFCKGTIKKGESAYVGLGMVFHKDLAACKAKASREDVIFERAAEEVMQEEIARLKAQLNLVEAVLARFRLYSGR